jgi:hypothetical protein
MKTARKKKKITKASQLEKKQKTLQKQNMSTLDLKHKNDVE